MANFDVDVYAWEVEEGVPVDLVVRGDFQESRAQTQGPAERWAPGWTELEIQSIENVKGCELPRHIFDRLVNDENFCAEIEQRISRGSR